MTPFLRYSIRFIFILLMQYILCTMAPLGGYITPYFYFVFILWLPFSINRINLLLVAVLFGLTLDYFLLTPGLHASSCLLIAYLRPFLLNLLLAKEIKELNYAEPSIRSMNFMPYMTYIIILILIHHGYLIFLQLMSVGNFFYFLKKMILTSLVSLLLVGILDIIFQRKLKTRLSLK